MARMANSNNNIKINAEITGAATVASFMEYIIALICGILFVFLPLYMEKGYYQIGATKYRLYRGIILPGLGIMTVLCILYFILSVKYISRAWIRQNLSSLDIVMLLYLLCVFLSFSVCHYKDSAIWGYKGWYMGLISQLTFVAFYFFTSRFCIDGKALLVVLYGVSAIVFLLGVLNRFLIDPLGIYEGISDFYTLSFLSTLGQPTWYSSFMSTVLPMGLYFYWDAKKTYLKRLSGVYCILGFATLVTQNSDSAYIALICMLMVLFWFSVHDIEKTIRFFMITLFFVLATRIIYLLTLVGNTQYIDALDKLSLFLIRNPFMWVLMILNIVILTTIRILYKKGRYSVRFMHLLRNITLGVLVLIFAVGILCLYLSGSGKQMPFWMQQLASKVPYLIWNDSWGNGRGFTWRVTWNIFLKMDFTTQLLGVGPDCYAHYMYGNYYDEISTWFVYEGVLQNAHNEWFNALIDYGIAGAAAYLGFFITAIIHFGKRHEEFPLVGVIACIASYMGHNFFCYQQILCTPFIFCIIGIGENFIRRQKDF